MNNHFAYGIIDKHGKPYIRPNSVSVSLNRQEMVDVALFLNSAPNLGQSTDRTPFEVVPLSFDREDAPAMEGGNGN